MCVCVIIIIIIIDLFICTFKTWYKENYWKLDSSKQLFFCFFWKKNNLQIYKN